jgi:MOSC domain-containing protein YiiM
MQTFDHMDCGVYAQVIAGGDIAPGDVITISR